ncbi:hypothetical protein CJ178_21100 [Rhodococcus sp. ACPA4]|uniref:DUF5999 family protein n=1 Tax=Rhodococcus sp. ACPA4 TaxID=2028571 RepID=UPI000BB1157C|nr:DUF5999 family protein [Rhodococcus sp. ACPA4]PBC44675.1 hypothetical protein CJ178_21100 [Rhodococcus sp. ACPA4]
MCTHTPTCPGVNSYRSCSAQFVSHHAEQGWSLLCNGIALFDDGYFLAPDGRVGAIPQRGSLTR